MDLGRYDSSGSREWGALVGASTCVDRALVRTVMNVLVSTDELVAFVACARLYRTWCTSVGTMPPSPPRRGLCARAEHPSRDEAVAPVLLQSLERAGSVCRTTNVAAAMTAMGYTRARSARIIRNSTGVGIAEWRWAIAVRPALPELVRTEEHVDQIAYRCGYQDARYFHRDFKRLLGCAPRCFRRCAAHLRVGADRVDAK